MAESKVLFKNKWVEKLSRTNCYVVVGFFLVSALIISIIGGFRYQVPIFLQLLTWLSGLILFSLFEYLVHRYLFHSKQADNKGSWTYKLHNIHHDYPRDKKRLALPLPLGIFFLAPLSTSYFGLYLGLMRLFSFPDLLQDMPCTYSFIFGFTRKDHLGMYLRHYGRTTIYITIKTIPRRMV